MAYRSRRRLTRAVPEIIAKSRRLAHIERARQQSADLDRDTVAVDHNGTGGDRQVVGQDLDGVVFRGFEFDDGAAAEPQDLVNRHGSRTQHNGDIHRHLVECAHGLSFPLASCCGALLRRQPSGQHGMVNGWLIFATI